MINSRLQIHLSTLLICTLVSSLLCFSQIGVRWTTIDISFSGYLILGKPLVVLGRGWPMIYHTLCEEGQSDSNHFSLSRLMVDIISSCIIVFVIALLSETWIQRKNE